MLKLFLLERIEIVTNGNGLIRMFHANHLVSFDRPDFDNLLSSVNADVVQTPFDCWPDIRQP